MVDILNRYLSYFRTLRNNKRIIESVDIDSQFTTIADYLNNVIVPAVNDMQEGALPGINGSPNYFLTNVGDGSVTFYALNEVIVNSTIASTKIEKAVGNGLVLVSNQIGYLDVVGPTQANMVLTYRNGDVPIYKFITTENIEDRAITYADIADKAINREHLHPEILNILDAPAADEQIVRDVIITGDQFEDFSITSDKFLNDIIVSERKIGVIDTILPNNINRIYPVINKQHIKNGTIMPDKIKPNTIGAAHFNKIKCITPYKLAPDIIDDNWLKISPNCVYLNTYKDDNFFSDFMLSPSFRIEREHLLKSTASGGKYVDCVQASDFEPVVQRAFRRFGCV